MRMREPNRLTSLPGAGEHRGGRGAAHYDREQGEGRDPGSGAEAQRGYFAMI